LLESEVRSCAVSMSSELFTGLTTTNSFQLVLTAAKPYETAMPCATSCYMRPPVLMLQPPSSSWNCGQANLLMPFWQSLATNHLGNSPEQSLLPHSLQAPCNSHTTNSNADS
jgi:hypothetical protein